MGDAKRRKDMGLTPGKSSREKRQKAAGNDLPLAFQSDLTLPDLRRVGEMFPIEFVAEFAAKLDAEMIQPSADSQKSWPWEMQCAWAYPPFRFFAKRVIDERPVHIPESAARIAITNLVKGFALAANQIIYSA